MRETVELIVKALVDDKSAVDVREIDRGGLALIEVRVAPGDMGKVIGKQGRTIKALRSLVGAVGAKRKRRLSVELVETVVEDPVGS
jgi:predicted RNA-binding protein YlqC (UPF0109 family)